jgi:Domain of unknown function (DUF4332)
MANQISAYINGVGPKYSALLAAAGIETVDDLAKCDVGNLAKSLADVNAAQGVVKTLPSQEDVAAWIGQASGEELARVRVAIKVLRDMLDVSAYSWQASERDDPHKIKQDRLMFNRKEGYEVIPMIQRVANTFGFESVDNVKRIEAVIAKELPGNVRSRKNVYNWLVAYFETH